METDFTQLITDSLKEFESVTVKETELGVLVEDAQVKDDTLCTATPRQVLYLKDVCNYTSVENLFKLDRRVAFKIISLRPGNRGSMVQSE